MNQLRVQIQKYCVNLYLNQYKRTVTIKSTEDKEKIQKTLSDLKRKGKLNAFEHCGKLKLQYDPIEIQKMMRNEW